MVLSSALPYVFSQAVDSRATLFDRESDDDDGDSCSTTTDPGDLSEVSEMSHGVAETERDEDDDDEEFVESEAFPMESRWLSAHPNFVCS